MNGRGDDVVAICSVAGGIMSQTLRTVREQYPGWSWYRQRKDHPTDYGDDLRRLWRSRGHLVVVEQDVVPPRDAIRELLGCPEDWCTYPHWTGERYDVQTLGLAKFGADMRYLFPHLADRALAGAWRKLTGPAVAPGQDAYADAEDPQDWPTTAKWTECDVRLAEALRREGFVPHVHLPSTLHLHAYGRSPERSGEVLKPDPKL